MTPEKTESTPAEQAWGLERPSLGLSLGGAHSPEQVDGHRAWVQRAESLGLHSVWLPEMHFAPGTCSSPLHEIAGFASLTERLRFGTTSLLLPLHPPSQIAAEIAAVDQISRGRLLVGLGRGFNRKMLDAFGVPAALKRDRFDAALEEILSLWASGNAENTSMATYQKPHPPLAVAAFGKKGLAQAARHGLPYLASPVESLDQIAENQASHRAQLPDPDTRPLSLVMRTVFVSDNRDEQAQVREILTHEMTGRRAGMPAAIQKALDAPLEERVIIGSVAEVAARLASDRVRLEFDLLIVRPKIAKMDQAILEQSLTYLATEIWPSLTGASRSLPE